MRKTDFFTEKPAKETVSSSDSANALTISEPDACTTMLHEIVSTHPETPIDELLAAGANILLASNFKNGENALHLAILHSHSSHIQKMLLELHRQNLIAPALMSKDVEGNTPLHYCATLNDEHTARLLLSFGGQPEQINHSGLNPVYIALSNGYLRLAIMLLKAARGPKKTNTPPPINPECYANTALPISAPKSRESLHDLISKGSSAELLKINLAELSKRDLIITALCALDESGNTPLHIAVYRENLPCIKLLLEFAADPHLTNRHGLSCVELVKITNNRNVAEIFAQILRVSSDKLLDSSLNHPEPVLVSETAPPKLQPNVVLPTEADEIFHKAYKAQLEAIETVQDRKIDAERSKALADGEIQEARVLGRLIHIRNQQNSILAKNSIKRTLNLLPQESIHQMLTQSMSESRDAQLRKAVETKNLAEIEALLKLKATPTKEMRILELFAHSGVTPSQQTYERMTKLLNIWLEISVRSQDLDSVNDLLHQGANANHTNENGYSMLMLSVVLNNIRTTKLLITHGANVNYDADDYECSPLKLSLDKKNEDIACLLLSCGANPKNCLPTQLTPIHMMSLHNLADVLKAYLLNRNIKINVRSSGISNMPGATSLHIAARYGHTDCVIILLNAGANRKLTLANSKIKPIDLAKHYGHVEVVKLLKYTWLAKPKTTRFSALKPPREKMPDAITNPRLFIEEHKPDAKTNPSTNEQRLGRADQPQPPYENRHNKDFSEAIEQKNISKAIMALNLGADPNTRDSHGAPMLITLLREPISIPAINLFLQLLAHGADPNKPDRFGVTALHITAQNGDFRLTELLCFLHANVNATQTDSGETPLMLACTSGHLQTANVLIHYGADISAQTIGRQPRTALELAATHGHHDVSAFLDQKLKQHQQRQYAARNSATTNTPSTQATSTPTAYQLNPDIHIPSAEEYAMIRVERIREKFNHKIHSTSIASKNIAMVIKKLKERKGKGAIFTTQSDEKWVCPILTEAIALMQQFMLNLDLKNIMKLDSLLSIEAFSLWHHPIMLDFLPKYLNINGVDFTPKSTNSREENQSIFSRIVETIINPQFSPPNTDGQEYHMTM